MGSGGLGIPKRGCGTSVLGTEVPQRGPGAEPRWVSGSDAPRSYGHYATFTTHNKRKLQYKEYTTRQNRTNLAQEIGLCGPVKANLSTTSTGSTGVVCACTWISANDVSRSSLIDDRRYVFSSTGASGGPGGPGPSWGNFAPPLATISSSVKKS